MTLYCMAEIWILLYRFNLYFVQRKKMSLPLLELDIIESSCNSVEGTEILYS